MKVTELGKSFGFETVVQGKDDSVIATGYTSDLLSDVMANAGDASVLITIQAHRNTIAVASLAGIAAVVICNGRAIPDDMAEAASAESVWVFRTGLDQFRVSGLLYSAIMAGSSAGSAAGGEAGKFGSVPDGTAAGP